MNVLCPLSALWANIVLRHPLSYTYPATESTDTFRDVQISPYELPRHQLSKSIHVLKFLLQWKWYIVSFPDCNYPANYNYIVKWRTESVVE